MRKIDVLVEIAMGYSAKEIAIRLDLAPRTVDKHVETMLLKLCARNRSHMVVTAIHDGIICLIGGTGSPCAIVPCDEVRTRVNVHPTTLVSGMLPMMARRSASAGRVPR